MVQLSFRNVYWMDLKSPQKYISPELTQGGALNFLQLAAKLHEQRFLYVRFWLLSLCAALLVVLSGPSSATCLETPSIDHNAQPAINVTIDQDYANHLSRYGKFHSQVPGGSVQLTNKEASEQRGKLLAIILAGVAMDGMPRIAGNSRFPYSASVFLESNRTSEGELQGVIPTTSAKYGVVESLNTTNISDMENWLKIDFSFSRYGYGYMWHGSRATQFGISVLPLHIAVTICHTLLVLIEIFRGQRAVYRAWETIPEMLVFAMNSSPSEKLRRVYAKDGTIKTWREVVAVRESDESALEVVVGREDVKHSAPARRGTGFSTIFQAPSKK
ncbi:hypothetical protein BDZ45DRAFT_770093 [Acephala macrosclerotiorum]|nr:hypothetical protein BDZ45DRAFT_770093 [Acephala macrosclerotiorum]